MMIDSNTMLSITEANQNFSKVAKLVDTNGSAVILKNNDPKYIVLSYEQAVGAQLAKDEDVFTISKRLISQNLEAYQELAK